MKIIVPLLLAAGLLTACQPQPDLKQAIREIEQAELAFSQMADSLGVAIAFYEYAAEGAVINRGGIIEGRDAIRKFYEPIAQAGVKFSWKPDTVFVSQSGDLGYTYGKYIHQTTDSTGNVIERGGIFHTVWRKQTDGTWKYVWD